MTEEELKVWWKSKGVLGPLVTAASIIAYLLGLGPLLGGEEITTIVNLILLFTTGGGLLTSLIGRVTASTKITLFNQNK